LCHQAISAKVRTKFIQGEGVRSEGLLSGKRVVDLTQNVAGPFCTQILGDLGAEVIKIERPGSGDDTRSWRPPEISGWSSTFLALNRNKRSIAVDIDRPEGQRVVRDLAKGAQIFVHSLKPGSAERRGLGFDDLKAINPDLIYCAISAFGQRGPMAGLPGYDPLLQAFTGIMSVTGSEGQDPVRVSVSLIDMGTGIWSALGILGALLRQQEGGGGVLVESSLLETGVSWMTILAAGYLAEGVLPKRMGSAMAMTAPYELFRCADGHLFIAAGNDRLFRAVCNGLGSPGIADDERFITNRARVEHRDALHDAIEQITLQHPANDLIAKLRAVGAPCSAMNSVADMLSNEQVAAVDIVREMPLSTTSPYRVIGLPVRIDEDRGVNPGPPPELGADTEAVLENLGYSTAEVDRLRSCGAIG
jgi:formyl-CoA transferase/CoA:oxalate CoA-transferase